MIQFVLNICFITGVGAVLHIKQHPYQCFIYYQNKTKVNMRLITIYVMYVIYILEMLTCFITHLHPSDN